MNAVVFGSTGLLGRAVVAALRTKGHEVETPGRGSSPHRAEVVYDCSGQSSTLGFESDIEAAWDASTRLLWSNLSRVSGFQRYVYSSSSRVYRVREGGPGTDEARTPGDLVQEVQSDRYALSKITCESILRHELRESGIAVRFCGMFGPGMKKGVMYDIANNMPIWCAPDSEFQLLSSEQAAWLMLLSAQINQPSVNAASSNFLTPEKIADALGVPLQWNGGPEAYERGHKVDRIKLGVLGAWAPEVSI